jgi:hypothetical protein
MNWKCYGRKWFKCFIGIHQEVHESSNETPNILTLNEAIYTSVSCLNQQQIYCTQISMKKRDVKIIPTNFNGIVSSLSFLKLSRRWKFVTPCSVAVGHQRFGGSCCLHLHFTLPWKWRQQCPPKWWYPIATQHGITTHKTSTRSTWHNFDITLHLASFLSNTYEKWFESTDMSQK